VRERPGRRRHSRTFGILLLLVEQEEASDERTTEENGNGKGHDGDLSGEILAPTYA
jgi:hypothetical protein